MGSQEPNKFFSISFTSQKPWTPNRPSKRGLATWPKASHKTHFQDHSGAIQSQQKVVAAPALTG